MEYISNYIFEKLKIDSKAGFAARYKGLTTTNILKTQKFKKFFSQLEDIGGLVVGVHNFCCYTYNTEFVYKIRSQEPDKLVYKNGKPRTWKACLQTLWDEQFNDIRTDDIVRDLTSTEPIWCCTLGNLDESEIKELVKIGFIDLSKYDNDAKLKKDFLDRLRNENQFHEFCNVVKKDNDNRQVFIFFKDLYENIDKIYKDFFE